MLRSIGLMAFLVCFTGYWAYHLMNGPRSIFMQENIRDEQIALAAELERLHEGNAALLAQIQGLRPETLDADLLIERLHSMSLMLPGEALLHISN